MPTYRPTLSELVAIAHASLTTLREPECRFELRLVAHALEIVAREIEQSQTANQLELGALRSTLTNSNVDVDVDVDMDEPHANLHTLNRNLCTRLEQGTLLPTAPAFLTNMRACVRARLAIDNPRFEGSTSDDKT